MTTVADWARYSVPDDFWPVAIILLVFCIGGFVGWLYYFMRMRMIQNIPTSKIRSAAQGYLELTGEGKLMDGPEIFAPLTGKICTWYSFEIQERRRSGRKNRWVTIEKGLSEELFLLVDETGQCVIDPEGASVVSKHSDTWYGTSSRPRQGSIKRGGLLSSGRYRYNEKRMHPDDPLYAIGLYQTTGGASTQFNLNSDVLALLKEWKSDSDTLLKKYDKNSDGQIDVKEWESVRKAALNKVKEHHQEIKSVPPVNIMTKTRDTRRPFILSVLPQDELVRTYKLYFWGLIGLFFISGAFLTWIIDLRFYGA
jgi:hypothetical protein